MGQPRLSWDRSVFDSPVVPQVPYFRGLAYDIFWIFKITLVHFCIILIYFIIISNISCVVQYFFYLGVLATNVFIQLVLYYGPQQMYCVFLHYSLSGWCKHEWPHLILMEWQIFKEFSVIMELIKQYVLVVINPFVINLPFICTLALKRTFYIILTHILNIVTIGPQS